MQFDEVFEDKTKYGAKIKTDEYQAQGKNIIVDQGQALIAGYTDKQAGLFTDVPAIVFGDHTRVVKYIDKPFFLGADGVKVLKSRLPDANYKYLYYALLHAKIPNTGYNRHFKWLKELDINYPIADIQAKTVAVLDKINAVISLYQQQLFKLDKLGKARFAEMFGDLLCNSNHWPQVTFENICDLITDGEHATPRKTEQGIYLLSARNIANHSLLLNDVDYIDDEEYNRIAKRIIPQENDILLSCSGSIGRCCRVPKGIKLQMVRSVALLRPSHQINPTFLECLIQSDYLQSQIRSSATQSSQANLFQGRIQKLRGYIPPPELQNQFADYVTQVERTKAAVQSALDKAQLLFDSLMQKYFG